MVTVQLTGGEVLRASVTRLALDEMGLGVGDRVTALIKAAAVDERSVVALNPTRQNP
jgi:molybdate transport system ATP-binding protein